MESLLALSFDNLSSRDNIKIRKGLRQIEGLLAQICLNNARLSPQKRSRSECKQLRDLRKDAAFREFFRLQEGFRWNGPPPPLPHLSQSIRDISSNPLPQSPAD